MPYRRTEALPDLGEIAETCKSRDRMTRDIFVGSISRELRDVNHGVALRTEVWRQELDSKPRVGVSSESSGQRAVFELRRRDFLALLGGTAAGIRKRLQPKRTRFRR